ncbi:hypothetical protein ACFO0J_01625 [Castellaniella hirudinis]|uniref:Glycosyltransferase RgtA/B/C/D-like domain-containing protein n=1 Tax=Castellaniella hirudinis TaxID=1144617 RepID=A0ABV8RV70_9BURK
METDKNTEHRPAGYQIQAGDLLSALVLGVFVALLIAGSRLPLYSDEVVTKWIHARFFELGGISSSLLPQCQTAFSSPLPWAYYPGATFFSVLYGSLSPLGLRLTGVALALVIVAGFSFWVWSSTRNVRGALRLLSPLVVLLTLGVLPFIWVMARPEQWLTLGLMFFCMTAIASQKSNGKGQWIWIVFYLPVASAFFFVHPKSIFFTPVVLLAAWFVARRPITRLLLITAVSLLAYVTYRWGVAVSACSEAPEAQAALSSNFLNPVLLLSSPVSFLLGGGSNFLRAPGQIAEHAVFAATFQSGWLPPMAVSGVTVWMAAISRFLITVVIFGALASSLLRLPMIWLRRRSVSLQVMLGAALALGLCANFFFYQLWPFYGAAQVLPLVLMLLLLMLPEHAPSWLWRPSVQIIRNAYLLFALTSMAIFAAYVVPEVWKRSNLPEVSVPGQWLSVPVLDFGRQRETIRTLAHQCGIQGDDAEHLVVDHLTYYAFNKLRQPIHALYISEKTYGGDLLGEKLVPFLESIKSPGVIAKCDYIPVALFDLPRFREGGYCCVPIPPKKK